MEPDRVAILAIGNEILEGQVLNTNTQWLCAHFAGLGAGVVHVAIVRDEPAEIGRELGHARSYGPRLVVTTGGLGPTDDDCTLASIASFFGLPLEQNETALREVRASYESGGQADPDTMTPARRKMALIPRGATPLSNRVGRAPGVLLETGGSVVLALPGVPEELEDIVMGSFQPHQSRLLRAGVRTELRLRAGTQDESRLAPVLGEVARRNPTVYLKSRARTASERAGFLITISSAGPERSETDRRAAAAEEDLRRSLSDVGIRLDRVAAASGDPGG